MHTVIYEALGQVSSINEIISTSTVILHTTIDLLGEIIWLIDDFIQWAMNTFGWGAEFVEYLIAIINEIADEAMEAGVLILMEMAAADGWSMIRSS